MSNQIISQRRSTRGQSLVEVALFIPLALIIIAGLVEVGQWLLFQNRVSSVARSAARFGANGGNDENMAIVGLNTVTETMPLDTARWDLFSIRGTVNADGTGFVGAGNDIEFNHIYGDGNSTVFAEMSTTAFRDDLRADILEFLQTQQATGNLDQASAADIQFVGTYAVFESESIIGLDYFVEEFYSVRDFAIMRTFPSSDAANGCTAFPILVQEQRSIDDDPSGSNVFPEWNDFRYPNFTGPSDALSLSDFPFHVPDQPLDEFSTPGTLYRVWNGGGPGNFGWIYWNADVSGSSDVARSLGWPGNSADYVNGPGGSPGPTSAATAAGFSHKVYGYIEPDSDEFPADTSLQIGDKILGRTGVVSSSGIDDALEEHIDNGRKLRFPIYDTATASGSNTVYDLVGFAIFTLHGYNLQQGWILAEFESWDKSCGQRSP